MKIGRVKNIGEPGKERDEERGWNYHNCVNCKQSRTVLFLLPYKRSTIRVCTNQKCFLFSDLTKLKTWEIQNPT